MTVVLILVGLAVSGAVGVLAAGLWRSRRARARILTRRLAALEAAGAEQAPERAPESPLQGLLSRAPEPLRVSIARAGGPPSGPVSVIWLAAVVAGMFIGARLWGAPGALAAVALGITTPLVVLQQLARRRAAAFTDGLPRYLDSLRQLLIVGQSVQLAFLRATEEAAPSMRRYLEPASRRVRNGGDLADALTLASERVAIPELQMLAAAVRLNLRFGGALAPVLNEVASTLRERARVGREVAAATAETRMSGLVLTLLPFAAVALLLLVSPDYVSYLWTTEVGRRMLAVAVVLQVVGVFAMRRLMRVEF